MSKKKHSFNIPAMDTNETNITLSSNEIKTFNKMFQEFLIEYNQGFNSCFRMTISSSKEIVLFYRELANNLELLKQRNSSLFKRITLFKKINLHNKVLNSSNDSIVWKYILQLLIVAYKVVDKNNLYIQDTEIFSSILNKWQETESTESLKSIHSTIDTLVPKTNAFNEVIKNIANKVNTVLSTKDMSSLEDMDSHVLQEKLISFLGGDSSDEEEEDDASGGSGSTKEVDSKTDAVVNNTVNNVLPKLENLLPGVNEMLPGFDFSKAISKMVKNKNKDSLNTMFNDLLPGVNLTEMIDDVTATIKNSITTGQISKDDCNEITSLFANQKLD